MRLFLKSSNKRLRPVTSLDMLALEQGSHTSLAIVFPVFPQTHRPLPPTKLLLSYTHNLKMFITQ